MSVRNLRAMFENKTQESPPDRGRSPGVSSSTNESASGTESPRPLSKVRTSFVAIEKDGRIGLQQRNPSEASSISGRKLSGDTEAASSVQLDNNTSTNVSSPTTSRSELNRGPPSATFHSSPPPPDPRSNSGSKPSPPANPSTSSDLVSSAPREVNTLAGAPKGLAESPQIKENQFAGGRKSDFGRKATKPAEAVAPGPVAPAQAPPPAGDDAKKTNGVNKTNGVKAVDTPAKSTPAKSATPAKAGAPAAPAPAPARAPASAQPAGVVPVPAPAPSSKVASKQAANSPDPEPQPKPAGKPANTASHPPTTPKAAKANTEKKAAPVSASPGFVKPRPKSPTRPVKLPPSLTTHTTASGSRTRTSGSAPPISHENSARSTSRTKALGRSSSAAGRQRPSIGPPPKLPAKDHPVVKKDAKVDEGFLARMMRPTQSSASKVNEKVPITPPRRPAAAPKKSASAKSVTTKRSVSKTTSATTSAAPSPERNKKEPSADGDIATAIEKMYVPEHVQEPPKTPEREATIMEELEEEKSGAALEASSEPEVEEAQAPLANGDHKETEGPSSADVTEAKSKPEEVTSQSADTGAQPELESW